MVTARLSGYLYNLARALDELLNAILAGNSRQTLSSRAYEAAVLAHIWYWRPVYWSIDAGAFAIRYILLRPFGYRPAKDWPINHCKDAFDSFPEDTTY